LWVDEKMDKEEEEEGMKRRGTRIFFLLGLAQGGSSKQAALLVNDSVS
jgi:hypothetical protein